GCGCEPHGSESCPKQPRVAGENRKLYGSDGSTVKLCPGVAWVFRRLSAPGRGTMSPCRVPEPGREAATACAPVPCGTTAGLATLGAASADYAETATDP